MQLGKAQTIELNEPPPDWIMALTLGIFYQIGEVDMIEHDIYVMRACVDSYLSHMRHIQDDITFIEEQINEIYNAASGLTGLNYDKDSVIVSTEGDKIGKAISRLEELRNQLSDKITENYGLLKEAKELCSPHYVGRHILWLNRVESKPFIQIAHQLHYSEDYTYELARGGVVDLYYAIPERYRRDTFPNAMPQ